MIDDVLDYDGDPAAMGKNVGDRMKDHGYIPRGRGNLCMTVSAYMSQEFVAVKQNI